MILIPADNSELLTLFEEMTEEVALEPHSCTGPIEFTFMDLDEVKAEILRRMVAK